MVPKVLVPIGVGNNVCWGMGVSDALIVARCVANGDAESSAEVRGTAAKQPHTHRMSLPQIDHIGGAASVYTFTLFSNRPGLVHTTTGYLKKVAYMSRRRAHVLNDS